MRRLMPLLITCHVLKSQVLTAWPSEAVMYGWFDRDSHKTIVVFLGSVLSPPPPPPKIVTHWNKTTEHGYVPEAVTAIHTGMRNYVLFHNVLPNCENRDRQAR